MIRRFFSTAFIVCSMIDSAAQAELYSMYTSDRAVQPSTGTTVSSSFGIYLNLSGVLLVPGPANQPPLTSSGFITTSLSGSGVVDMNLDASNSGTMNISGFKFNLADVSYSQAGFLFGFTTYLFSAFLRNVQLELNASNVNIVNGQFKITSSTVGSLSLNKGFIDFVVSIQTLGINSNGVLDLKDNFALVSFAELGSAVIHGTADDDDGGNDDGSPVSSPHGLGGPGLTGSSNLDTDGAEINLNLQGLTIPSSIPLGAFDLPVTIGFTGNISVSVPEAGSMTLVGLAGVAGLAVVRMRRRNG